MKILLYAILRDDRAENVRALRRGRVRARRNRKRPELLTLPRSNPPTLPRFAPSASHLPLPPASSLPLGVEGAAIGMIRGSGLAAACSVVPDVCAVPSVERVMAYARVVEACHARATVLPLRYGALLDTEAQVIGLLRRRRGELLASLAVIEGCTEMGIRALPSGTRGEGRGTRGKQSRTALAPRPSGLAPFSPPASSLAPPASPLLASASGRAYLASRGALYAEKDGTRREAEALTEKLCAAFDGLFRQCRPEHSSGGDRRLLSVAFLVPREREGQFRRAFREIEAQMPERLLLTGPWAPYSFAGPEGGADSIEATGDNGLSEQPTSPRRIGGRSASLSGAATCRKSSGCGSARHALCFPIRSSDADGQNHRWSSGDRRAGSQPPF